MSITLNEPIVNAVRDRLNANLAGEVATINAAVTDGFVIEAPQEVLTYLPTPALLTSYPTVGIGDGRSTFEDDVAFSATGRHELLIVAYLQHADQEALTWQLRRYAQALVRVVLDDRNLGTSAWGTGLLGVHPGPALADHADPEQVSTWMSWIGVRIWAKRDEE